MAWSAQRTLPAVCDSDPALWTGEHVSPWTLDRVAGYQDLRPCQEIADQLASFAWPRLYDEQRLQACTVPCAAVIYADDGVPRTLQEGLV